MNTGSEILLWEVKTMPTYGKAILVVSFGTSYRETCERNIGAIEREIAGAFPDWEVRRAFTSGMIMKKLRSRDNAQIDSVSEALERLAADGFSAVVVAPTHIINGEEYDGIVGDMAAFAGHFDSLAIGRPLLSDTGDYQELARIIGEKFPRRERAVLCLMGHGTEHFADSAYAALDYHFKDAGRDDVFVGTVEGDLDLEKVTAALKAAGIKKIWMAPLMTVAGDHATNDLFGAEPDSWKQRLAASGIAVEAIPRGLGETPDLIALWIDGLRKSAGGKAH